MLKFAAAFVVVIAGCVSDEVSESAQEVHGDTDGWGEWCNNPANGNDGHGHLWNPCYSVNGDEGICDVGVCRRKCQTSLGGCPHGFTAVLVASDGCVCEPTMKPWDYNGMAPAIEW